MSKQTRFQCQARKCRAEANVHAGGLMLCVGHYQQADAALREHGRSIRTFGGSLRKYLAPLATAA